MIVDTMTAIEVRKEYRRDIVKLQPIIDRRLGYLMKKLDKSGKRFFQTQGFYTINRNHYVVCYMIHREWVSAVHWHYVDNSDQPYFLASMKITDGDEYYGMIDPHAILRYMERTPDYVPTDKLAFAKEAMNVAIDMAFFATVGANFITPSGLWPLSSGGIVDGFIHIKTFIHKSMLNKRQTKIYKEGLRNIGPEAFPVFEETMKEFGMLKSASQKNPDLLKHPRI